MKLLSNTKKLSRKALLIGAVSSAVIGGALFHLTNAQAQNISFPSTTTVNCDSNAVVYCGDLSVNSLISKYTNGDGRNSVKSIHDIYNYFGIKASDIAGLSSAATNVQAGQVSKLGEVFDANGLVIATGGRTAGRLNAAGSMAVTSNGTTFYTSLPSVSFQSNKTLPAFIVTKNGVFQFAILASCGNPVSAKPKIQPKPNYTINKLVEVKGTTSLLKSVTVKPGTHVIYQVVVKSTGDAPVSNLVVSDRLPAHVSYVPNSLKRDGNSLTASASASFFGSGVTIPSLAAGSTTTFIFEAIVGPNDTPEVCTSETLNNVGAMTATSLPPATSTAAVSKQCLPKPVYACTSLTSLPNNRAQYAFTATATAQNGATITKYVFDFGDGQTKTVTTSATTATTRHGYAANLTSAKSYPTRVTVYVALPTVSSPVAVTSPACATTVKVAPAPIAECTKLNDIVVDDQDSLKVSVSGVQVVAKNGAKVQLISYDFGEDGQPPFVTNTVTTPAVHTYKSDGTYTIKATVTFTGAANIPPSICSGQITVTTPTPTCDSFDITAGANRTVTVTKFSSSDNGATFNNVAIDWGDSTTPSPFSKQDVIGKTHQFAEDKTYTVTAIVNYTINNQSVPKTSANCQQSVTFSPTVPPTVVAAIATPPAAPTALINSGAGNVIGLFAAITLAGAFLHRLFLSRRLSD